MKTWTNIHNKNIKNYLVFWFLLWSCLLFKWYTFIMSFSIPNNLIHSHSPLIYECRLFACCCLAWWWCGIIWRDGSSIRVSECQDRVRQDKTSEDKRREWMNEGRNKETNEMKKICNFLVFIAYQMLKSYNFIISIHSFWYHSIIKIIYFNVIVSCLYEGMMAIIMKQRGTRWGHFIQKLMILMIVGIVTAWQHEDFVMNL